MIFNRKKIVKEKKEELELAIDIGTEYVKSVIYKVIDGEVNVLGYSRRKQKESSMYAAFIINLTEVIDVIDASIGEAVTMARNIYGKDFVLPKDIIIGIAGELVQGVSIVVNVDRDNPDTEITERELEEVVRNVKSQTFKNTKEEIANEIGIKAAQIEEVNTYINSVYIDGLKVNNPLGYKGKELVYRVFSTFAPKIHLDSLGQIAEKLNLKLKHIAVEPYVLTLGLKNMRDPNTNAIIIDIGGGTTDLALVENGDIVGTKMFAIGGKVFTKRVQKELNLSWDEAEEVKYEYTKGTANKDIQSKLSKAFDKDIQVWLTGVELALEEFEDVKEYPPQIYLCGGGALLPEIQEGLMTHPWLQTLNFKKFPKINFVFPNSVKDVIDRTREAKDPMDVTPLSLARMSLEL